MVSGNDLNTFFTVYGPTISGIGGVCGILGFIGGGVSSIASYFLKKRADEADIVINNLKSDNAQIAEKINNLKIENARVINIINKYGLSLSDTKAAAADVFNEKAKNKPDIYMGEEEPEELSKGMIWPTGD